MTPDIDSGGNFKSLKLTGDRSGIHGQMVCRAEPNIIGRPLVYTCMGIIAHVIS